VSDPVGGVGQGDRLAVQRPPDGGVEVGQSDRHQSPDAVVLDNHGVVQAADQGACDPRRYVRHQPDPVRGEPRREDGHRNDQRRPSGCDPGGPLEDLPVGEDLRAADLEGLARRRRHSEHADEVGDDVADGHGLTAGPNPAGRHHHREPLGELADHLEARGAVADDDRRPEGRQVERPLAEDVLDLAARAEVRREAVALLAETAQVDHPLDAGGVGGLDEVAGRAAVALGELAARLHRVDEVVGGLDALEGGLEAPRFEQVPLRDVDSLRGIVPGGAADERDDVVAGRREPGDQSAADEPGRPGDEYAHAG
jgi:hypothetical protein